MLRKALFALLFCACAHAAWVPNLAFNGSAEDDANRDGAPDGWRTAAYRSPAKFAWDREVAHTGRASLRISDSLHETDTAWDANSGRWISVEKKPVSAEAEYTLAAWVKTNGVTGRATVAIAWYDNQGWLAENHSAPVQGTRDWTWVTVTARAPKGAQACMIYLCLSASKGTAWFDDVTLVRGAQAQGKFRAVDLRAVANTGFRDEAAGDGKGGWTDQGVNDAREIPTGWQVWRGVPFEIIDPEENGGRSCIVLRGKGRPDFPEAVTVPVGERCDVVYFLHNCAWAGAEGRVVGRYVVRYADGQTREVPLRVGREIRDWWNPEDTKDSAVGWEGSNPECARVGLSIFPWQNPRPKVAIESITVATAGTDAEPILVAITLGQGPPGIEARPLRLEFTDTAGWYPFEFDLEDTGLGEIDMSFLLDPPAGKHGFLTVGKDGHFYFEDGTRARFFGTNLGGGNCAPEKRWARIVARRLARFGINMVRLHAFDSRWGPLIDYSRDDSREFRADALDRFDYLIAQLERQGIYIYMDLLDYRRFMPGDGVKDAAKFEHGWRNSIKASSTFDPRMIELEKEYATKLLTHRNPYTGKRYVDDPGIAVVEITNENSVFYMNNLTLTLPVYFDDLRKRWNAWLAKRYGDRAALARAWTNEAGECALLPEEDPARGTVLFPLQHLYADLSGASYRGEKSPARLNAMTRFLYEVNVDYYRQMYKHLRSIGVRVPITGTNQDFSDASNFANYFCDFTTRNNYWQHPNVRAKPFFTFRNLSMVRSDILSTANPVANIASSSAVGKPLIVPEFNFPWPNEYRAECLPLMVAYACLQDWDGLLFFAYDLDEKILSHFKNQSDPVRWGQVPWAALAFLRRDVKTANLTVHIGHSETDIFATRPRRTSDKYSPYRFLPYISKVRNAYFVERYEGDADVVFASGHSAAGDYSTAKRAIVFADWPYVDEAARTADRAHSARLVAPAIKAVGNEKPVELQFGGFYTRGKLRCAPDTLLAVDSLPNGATPFGLTADGRSCLGFVSERFCVAPHISALQEADPAWPHRLYLAAARRWWPNGPYDPEKAGELFRSDTGELELQPKQGLFTIRTARLCAAVGDLASAGEVRLGSLVLRCRTPFAAVVVISLDGRELGRSERVLVTAVARAENTGQAYDRNHTRCPEIGRPPVIVEPVDCDLSLSTDVPLAAFALDPRGKKARELEVAQGRRRVFLNTAQARSPWILLEKR